MKLGLLAWLLFVSSAGAALPAGRDVAGPPLPGGWLPDRAIVDRIEQKVRLPAGRTISSYARFYTSASKGGHNVVLAFYSLSGVFGPTGTVHIVPPGEMPRAADGGCDFVNLAFDVTTDQFTDVHCNSGMLPPPPPPPPPGAN